MKRAFIAALVVASSMYAADTPDLQMQTRIRQEGFRNSKVMEIASGITDLNGARLTGSPNMKRANEWTRDKLTEFGLVNAHLESYPFGRGWSYLNCTVRMVSPDVVELWALPRAWADGTNGVLRAKAVKMKLETVEDLEKNRGKLAGKILLMGDAKELKPHDTLQYSRHDEKSLSTLAQYDAGPGRRGPFNREEMMKRLQFRKAFQKFVADEKIAAVIEPGDRDYGTFLVAGAGTQKAGDQFAAPYLAMSTEHYNRLARLADMGKDIELEINVDVKYQDDDQNAYNTIAEIPGTDKKGEVVMLGGHLDSWHGGTGATDNAAGVAAGMEAVRILKSLGIAPKRTIRIALWSGEEQGLLGSRAYVSQHFASRPEPPASANDLPSYMRPPTGPLTIKPEHAKLSAYFNIDNGGGKLRGIYAQENAAVRPIFEAWLEPLEDLGATTVTMRNTGSTDHVSFDAAGLPGFQFIQDPLEYGERTHHTNYDTYERLVKEDLMQQAVVMATFVWEAANRPEMMPRKPLSKADLEGTPAPTAQPKAAAKAQ